MADAGKGALIIILVIIGIGLVLYLLVNNVRIPAGSWAPFVDGTRIRIRSLLDDKYMTPGLRNGEIQLAPLMFQDTLAPETVWQLCQNPRSSNTRGEYALFYGLDEGTTCAFEDIRTSFSSSLTLAGPRILSTPLNLDFEGRPVLRIPLTTCNDIRQSSDSNIGVKSLLSGSCQFQLIENGQSALFGGVTSNVYYIRSANNDKVLTYSPISNALVQQVTMESVGNVVSLNQAFVIEVLSPGS